MILAKKVENYDLSFFIPIRNCRIETPRNKSLIEPKFVSKLWRNSCGRGESI
jgi:hypothetical protein